jgi:hypothetical protein
MQQQLLETDYPDLVNVFRSMTAGDPSCRPTAAAAFKSVQAYHESFTRTQLKGHVPKPNLDTMSMSEIFRRMREANARQAVREKMKMEAEAAQASAISS